MAIAHLDQCTWVPWLYFDPLPLGNSEEEAEGHSKFAALTGEARCLEIKLDHSEAPVLP